MIKPTNSWLRTSSSFRIIIMVGIRILSRREAFNKFKTQRADSILITIREAVPTILTKTRTHQALTLMTSNSIYTETTRRRDSAACHSTRLTHLSVQETFIFPVSLNFYNQKIIILLSQVRKTIIPFSNNVRILCERTRLLILYIIYIFVSKLVSNICFLQSLIQ